MRSIVLATHNTAKLREIRQVLRDLEVAVSLLEPDYPDPPPETGLTFAENARQKAAYCARATGTWSLADDSGLVVDALNGSPGVRSARYALDRCGPRADREQIDRANNTKLLEELKDVPADKRTARFICHLVLSDGDRVLIESSGTVRGRIAFAPTGENGFGYDPVFIPDGYECTMAELPPAQKNAISHRGQAVRRFSRLLRDLLKGNCGDK